MKNLISKHLDNIEKEYGVRIVFAIESGSRAWGFPSEDSDYDVRFVYIHEKNHYLTIAEKRDVIELPISQELDINGWDIRKALILLRKSNSPLLEWLSSPIRYRVWEQAFGQIRALSEKAFLPETSCHHYLSMAKSSIAKFGADEKVRIKTYLYAIRPVLCCEWIIRYSTQPPMRMDELLERIVDDDEFREAVKTMIVTRKENTEKYSVERSELIENYLNSKMREMPSMIPRNPPKPDIAEFDTVFRNILETSGS